MRKPTLGGAMRSVASTPVDGAGHAVLQDVIAGTQTFLSYTLPNDGKLHSVQAAGVLVVTGATETGGAISLVTTVGGNSVNTSMSAGSKAIGTTVPAAFSIADPGTVVSVQQTSSLTNHGTSIAGFAAVLQADA